MRMFFLSLLLFYARNTFNSGAVLAGHLAINTSGATISPGAFICKMSLVGAVVLKGGGIVLKECCFNADDVTWLPASVTDSLTLLKSSGKIKRINVSYDGMREESNGIMGPKIILDAGSSGLVDRFCNKNWHCQLSVLYRCSCANDAHEEACYGSDRYSGDEVHIQYYPVSFFSIKDNLPHSCLQSVRIQRQSSLPLLAGAFGVGALAGLAAAYFLRKI